MQPLMESDFVSLFIGSSVSPVAIGSLQAGLVEVYGDEGYELGRQALMGIGGIESADAGKADRPPRRARGRPVRSRLRPGPRAVRVPRRERVGDRRTVMGDPSPTCCGVPSMPSGPAPPRVIRSRRGRLCWRSFDQDDVRQKFGELDLWLERGEIWMGVRERTKATCVLTINEMRLDALEIGRRLTEDGTLESADQIYFLTFDEFRSGARGGDVDLERAHARETAKADLLRHQEPLFAIAGQIAPVEDWPLKADAVPDAPHRDEVIGAAASPGVATGLARVIMDAYADDPTEPGEVLVAPITDPGWLPLFVGAVAVVVEMGGELSHTMIVSRDLGLPAVVGAVGATSTIKTGDLVEVDGSNGIVRILERA